MVPRVEAFTVNWIHSYTQPPTSIFFTSSADGRTSEARAAPAGRAALTPGCQLGYADHTRPSSIGHRLSSTGAFDHTSFLTRAGRHSRVSDWLCGTYRLSLTGVLTAAYGPCDQSASPAVVRVHQRPHLLLGLQRRLRRALLFVLRGHLVLIYFLAGEGRGVGTAWERRSWKLFCERVGGGLDGAGATEEVGDSTRTTLCSVRGCLVRSTIAKRSNRARVPFSGKWQKKS